MDVGSKVPGAAPRGNEHILVADDQANLLVLMERLLVRAGYTVTAVANGAEAVAAAAREPFDLHILDAMMPELGGREARERIREKRADARFLFLSGYGGDALPEAYVKAQGIELVAKPFDPDTLLRAVRARLDAGRDEKGTA
ncbi:MAG TPA: response regulator [Polyangiaceae bacterium]|nr:response regulator [Polyangiaceae bacterium]